MQIVYFTQIVWRLEFMLLTISDYLQVTITCHFSHAWKLKSNTWVVYNKLHVYV